MGQFDWLLSTIDNPNNWGRWKPGAAAANEGGVDLTLPHGTPIYALASGTLVGAGTFTHADGSPGYGVVTEQVSNVPGLGKANVYYQHIDIAQGIKACQNGACGNQTIQKGQLIGYTRPDMYGLEVGINPTWRGVWAGNTAPGPWVTDPRPYLKALAQQTTTPTTTPTTTQTPQQQAASQVNQALGTSILSTAPSVGKNAPTCTPPSNALDVAGAFSYLWCNMNNAFVSFGEHIAVFLIGLLLIIGGVYLLAHKQINAAVGNAAKAGEKGAEVAAL